MSDDNKLVSAAELIEKAVLAERKRVLKILTVNHRAVNREAARFSAGSPDKRMYLYTGRLLGKIIERVEDPKIGNKATK